jgi:hypothetical protein
MNLTWLFDFLYGLKTRLGFGSSSDLPYKLERCTPVMSCTSELLCQIVASPTLTLRIHRSDPLPTFRRFEELPSTVDFSAVANRLKVISGLNPVQYHQPAEGSCRLVFGNQGQPLHCLVFARFDDHASDPFFEVTMTKTSPDKNQT